jgi:hypothetical protein
MKIKRRRETPPPNPAAVRRDERGQLRKGSVLNPVGGPLKGETWKDMVSEIMKEGHLDGTTRRERILRRVAELAEAGVPWAVEFCARREEPEVSRHEISAPPKRGPDLTKIPKEVLEGVLRKIANV